MARLKSCPDTKQKSLLLFSRRHFRALLKLANAAHHHAARLQAVDNAGDGALGEADLRTELLQTQALGLYQGLHHHALRPGKTAARKLGFQWLDVLGPCAKASSKM
jgi:hypothetical protein